MEWTTRRRGETIGCVVFFRSVFWFWLLWYTSCLSVFVFCLCDCCATVFGVEWVWQC